MFCLSAFDQKSPCSEAILDAVTATQRGLKVPCHLRSDASTSCTDTQTTSVTTVQCVNAIHPDSPCSRDLINAFNAAVLRLIGIDALTTTAAATSWPGFAFTSTTGKNLIGPSYTESSDKGSPVGLATPASTARDASAVSAPPPVAGASDIGVANHPNNESDMSHAGKDDSNNATGTSRGASFSARELGTYLGISFAVLLVLCAMAAFMTWKALQSKRRRTGSEFDAEDTPSANGFELEGGADGTMQTDLFQEPVPIIDDEELRWKGCDVELSPTDSGVASMGSPFSATDHDAAILFGPEGALTPSLHVPQMLDDGDGDPMTPTNMKKRAFQDEAAAALDLNGTGRSSAGPSSASTSYEPSSPIVQMVATPIEASQSAPPVSSTKQQQQQQQRQQQRQTPASTQSTATRADVANGDSVTAPPKARRRTQKQPEPVAASRDAIASFMSGGSHTRHLVYETQTSAGASAASSASTTAVSSPMDRTPSPAAQQQQQQPLSNDMSACVQQAEPSLLAYSNIKLLET